jgi:hypothetical protein
MLAATDRELSFAAYQERQLHEISPTGVAARAAQLRPADQFRFQDGAWVPQPYIGHAVVSMVDSTPANAPLVSALASIQNGLLERLAAPLTLYPLPAASFHQTIANTLSAEKHQRLIVDRGLATDFPSIVTHTFADIPATGARDPLTMRMVGLSIFGTALGLLGIFDREEGFHRVLHFRDHFYGDVRLADLGIRRTRPFIGHITLAYVERELDDATRARLVDLVISINRELSLHSLHFHLPAAELRAYRHLAEFTPLPGLPQFPL